MTAHPKPRNRPEMKMGHAAFHPLFPVLTRENFRLFLQNLRRKEARQKSHNPSQRKRK